MKIRQYTAPTLQEALIKIKLDLGPDAVILHQRKLKKGGFLGFFGKELVEVLAAVDNSPPGTKKKARESAALAEETDEYLPAGPKHTGSLAPRAPTGAPGSGGVPGSGGRTGVAGIPGAGGIGPWDAPMPDADDVPAIATGNPLAAIHAAMAQQAAAGQVGRGHADIAQPGTRQQRVRSATTGADPGVHPAYGPDVGPGTEQLKTAVLGELSEQVREVVARAVGSAVGELADQVAERMADKVDAAVSRLETATPAKGSWTPVQQKVYDRLLKADLDATLARQVLVKLHAAGANTEEQMAERLTDVVSSFVKVAGPIKPAKGGEPPQVVILVGPTGVGKTTTIAKLAATARLAGRAVSLITIDTYRIAAVEQLKVYGDIIGIPVDVVMTPGALREAIGKMKDREIILIDTAGRSPSHKLHLNELRSFLEAVPDREVHLVLSATTTRANLVKAIESFSAAGLDRLLITKVDEAATLGA
ncbi:MAG: AAA family ATPase, partial [Candidatus Sericytochromatia bacterium]|nr:AAA family ATPase [Candidatus Tanganyikabacteria bacterium]